LWGILDRHAKPITFDAIRIKLAAPQKIRDWSHGEVKKPETINYRTFKPERERPVLRRIFGPTKDYESPAAVQAHEVRRVVCDKCGVEVTRARVRRERMATSSWPRRSATCGSQGPALAHRAAPRHVTARAGEDPLLRGVRGSRVEDPGHQEEGSRLGGQGAQDDGRARPDSLKVGMGAEAIRELLRDLDLDALARDLRAQMLGETSVQKRKKIVKRLKVIEAFLKSGNQPDWMILEVVPVIPARAAPTGAIGWWFASRPPTSTTSIAA